MEGLRAHIERGELGWRRDPRPWALLLLPDASGPMYARICVCTHTFHARNLQDFIEKFSYVSGWGVKEKRSGYVYRESKRFAYLHLNQQ